MLLVPEAVSDIVRAAGFACDALDGSVKSAGLVGPCLPMTGGTVSVGSADAYVLKNGEKRPRGVVLAPARVNAVKEVRSGS